MSAPRAPRTKPPGLTPAGTLYAITDGPLADARLVAVPVGRNQFVVYQWVRDPQAARLVRLEPVVANSAKARRVVDFVVATLGDSLTKFARALNKLAAYKHLRLGLSSNAACGQVTLTYDMSAPTLAEVSCPECRSETVRRLSLAPFLD